MSTSSKTVGYRYLHIYRYVSNTGKIINPEYFPIGVLRKKQRR